MTATNTVNGYIALQVARINTSQENRAKYLPGACKFIPVIFSISETWRRNLSSSLGLRAEMEICTLLGIYAGDVSTVKNTN
jgi:hypothetical protein